MVQVSKNYMAGVDKFGAAFAVGFMVLMLAFMGGLTPGGLPGMTDSTAPPPQRDLMEEQTQAMSSPPVVPSQPEPSSHDYPYCSRRRRVERKERGPGVG